MVNAKFDDRNFKRIEKFNNKTESWKEWKLHFTTCVRKCDTSFADFIWGLEKRADEICFLSLDPTQSQLAAALYSRLISVTTGEAFRMVDMTEGNGREAWRLLNQRYDPQADARLASLIIAIVNFRIKGKDIQSGLVQWEQMILSLEQDHEEKLNPKLRRAFMMNVLPSWMQGKVMEHLDRLKSYAEVREKVVSLCHTCSGDAPDCNPPGV